MPQPKRLTGLIAAALVVGACGAAIDPPAESTTAPPVASSTAPPTTTAPPATSTTVAATTVAPVGPEALPIPRLDNELPATFVAVTEGWEAVEVDTATGAIVRSIGVMERPGEADDEVGSFAAIDRVWRTADLQWYVVSECCEPAAGMIHYLDPATTLTEENHDSTASSDGWSIAPSPFDGRIAKLGYSIDVGEVGAAEPMRIWLDQPGGPGFANGAAAWDRDGTAVLWISEDFATGTSKLWRLDLATAQPTAVELPWIGSDQWLDGIGSQAGGNLVGFLNTRSDDPETAEAAATEGVVFTKDGELVATFSVEAGSLWGGYDPSGRVLIYTDGDNVVRWQGLGQSGELGAGFIHASW